MRFITSGYGCTVIQFIKPNAAPGHNRAAGVNSATDLSFTLAA
jgi:ATP:corrinoid adenosyltransferase